MATRYGIYFNTTEYSASELDLLFEMEAIKKGGKWTDSKGKSQGLGLPEHYKKACQLIWPHIDWHRWNELCNAEIRRPQPKCTVLMGCGCVAGHTKILNPITREQPTIQWLYENKIAPMVLTLDGPVQAEIPFIKGVEQLFEVVLENGTRFEVTSEHRVLTSGGFFHVFDLRVGDSVFSYGLPSEQNLQESISALDPSTHRQGVRYFQKTTGDFQSHCSVCFCLYDGQLLAAKEACLLPSPSPIDVLKRKAHIYDDLDVLDSKPLHTHLYQSICPLSTKDVFLCTQNSEIFWSHRSDEEIVKPLLVSSRFFGQSQTNSNLHQPFSLQAHGDIRSGKSYNFSYLSQKDFSFPLRVSQSRVVSITKTHKDIYYDICVPEVEHYFAEGAIHHNSSGKTNTSGWQYLLEYYCRPDDTLVLISSTDMRGLELRVWGEIKKLHDKALERFSFLPGYLVDSKHCITTDRLDEQDAEERIRTRDLRKGVIGIPTVQGGKNVGLGKWQGIKQRHLRLIADDCTAMSNTFLSAFANLNNNEDFQALVLGNPDDVLDPLGIAAEPKDGWTNHLEPDKTSVWDTKFFNGRCINLVGTDSPNFDFDQNLPPKFPYLVSKKKIAETLSAFQTDSFEYFSQCVGVMKIAGLAKRVITRDLCREFNASGDCIWSGETTMVKISGLDASYGGDRMPLGYIEFGKCVDGKTRIKVHAPHLVSLKVKTSVPMDAETQIAHQVKSDCEANSIPAENFFHDSTGRGSLGTALARVWSASCNPVEFGGVPTKRPVSNDIFIYDKEKVGIKRLMRCDEAYTNFVTELWYSIRLCIEADQIRGLPEDVMNELCMRRFEVKNEKKKLETKEKFKEQYGFSPDLADWLAICVEGARRKGFQISKLSAPEPKKDYKWLDEMAAENKKLRESKSLQAA